MQEDDSDYYMNYAPKSEDLVIWRFMDFTKFLSILDSKSLFFSRSDRLGDPFEGSAPVGDWKALEETAWGEELTEAGKLEKVELKFHSYFNVENRKKSREEVCVSCWYMNEHESAAMWKLYAEANQAVAIRSTIKRLHESLPAKFLGTDLFLGVVHYIDYQNETIDGGDYVTNRLFYKRKSFKHEEELRAIFLNWRAAPLKQNEDGVYVPVDLEKLIDRVYIGPGSPQWFLELVQNISTKFGLNKGVFFRTSLDDKALF